MSKHLRDESDEFPLQRSIKKLKIDNTNECSHLPHHCESMNAETKTDSDKLSEMNRVLKSLHFLRLGRIAEKTLGTAELRDNLSLNTMDICADF